jgi:hypothetical protein
VGDIHTLITKSSRPKSGQECWAAERERQSAKKVKPMEIERKYAIMTGARASCYDRRESRQGV